MKKEKLRKELTKFQIYFNQNNKFSHITDGEIESYIDSINKEKEEKKQMPELKTLGELVEKFGKDIQDIFGGLKQ